MHIAPRHSWKLSPRAAIALQHRLAAEVRREGAAPTPPFLVAGCDATGSGRWSRGDERILAAVVLLQVPGGALVDATWAEGPSPFPYVPGLLSFREAPLYVAAFRRLRWAPDLILCDGQGIAHPRRLGLAAHLGLWLERPTIGVAKSRLVGTHRVPGCRRGSHVQLRDGGEVVGRVVRTQTGVRPLYVSTGHQIDLASAVRLVLHLAPRYRLPEPTRLADRWVSRLRQNRAAVPTG